MRNLQKLDTFANDDVFHVVVECPRGATVKLKPGLVKYRVEFGMNVSGDERMLSAVGNLVCGDAYLIDGQSNALATDTTLTSTLGATQSLSSPFRVTGCGALAFTPSFSASSDAMTSKLDGASLHVGITQPAHQANIASVVTSLPTQLVTRLTTLQLAERLHAWRGEGRATALLIGGPVAYSWYRQSQYRNFRIVADGKLYRSGQMSMSALQRTTDHHVAEVDRAGGVKEQEVLEV